MAAPVVSTSKLLEVRVEEASGKNRSEQYVWDSESFECFVKAEVRGGEKPVRATTQKATVKDCQITWQEDLTLEVTEGATELRLLLCREKTTNGKKGVSVITACGIFVKDILEAVPIDKYFEMFKPGSGQEGGYIRLRMRLITPGEVSSRELSGSTTKTKKGGIVPKLVVLGGLVAAGAFLIKRIKQ